MPSCVFKDCKNSSQKQKKEDGISFHRLPTDAVLRDKWVSVIRQNRQDNNWLPSKFCVVCSLHFKEADVYFTAKDRRLIKKTSVPANILSISVTTNINESSMDPIKVEDQCSLSNSLPVNEESINPCKTEPRIEEPEIEDSDLESLFDSPRSSQLRKKLRKQTSLRINAQRKLKTLQQKIRRLKRRNISLNKILKDLKDGNFTNSKTHNLLSQNIIATELFNKIYVKKAGNKKITYSPAIRKFCLSLNLYSPKAYQYVRKSFNYCLPHPKTMAKWQKHVTRNELGNPSSLVVPQVIQVES